MIVFFCQAEDGIRDLVRSRGLGDVYKRQAKYWSSTTNLAFAAFFDGYSAPQVTRSLKPPRSPKPKPN